MKLFLFAAAVTILGGCSIAKDQAEISRYYSGQTSSGGSSANISTELHNLIKDVANTQSTVETNVDGVMVRGVYTGKNGPCINVSVVRLETSRKATLRPEDYAVCGQRVAKVAEDGVTPSYPDTADARSALANAKRNAALYGSQSVRFHDYVISTRRLGLDSSRPCRPVETVISHQGRIVFHDSVEVCI